MWKVLAERMRQMWKEDYVKVNDVHLHYVTKGEGELMLFLHGFPYFWYNWNHQMEAFAEDYKVVAVDMRGYNLSDKPEDVEAYKMKILVDDVKKVIEAFGEKECILVAHDWGGAIAWSLAYTDPSYVKKLIMFDAPHPHTFRRELAENPAQREASSYMGFFQRPDAHELLLQNDAERVKKIVTYPGLEKGYLTEEEAQKYVDAWTQPGAMNAMLNYYRAISFFPFEEHLKKPLRLPYDTFEAPTLLIWGDDDIAFENSNLDGIEAYVPDITIHRMPGVGHAPHHEKPAEVNGYMRAFLERK
ncbi:alpha/beta hydrolase [Halobacillus sp. ACCC02827]|uniref:alpha/beta fold hydrolase n=1 Tax=Bacillaceae TaxID=186817 RepID=UPI0002A4D222|nr:MULTISPECIES: alpha/beta hydrolase [Bacillaceae]ELK47831.1 AB hydrolase superfamily protein [Halobacillus sp. BAB-2008]WJE15721.1 alpha/beta hydrolase [Halobacillus sp. ACCC02827]